MSEPVLKIQNLNKTYSLGMGLLKGKRPLRALNGVSLSVENNQVIGQVLETGCVKARSRN